MWEGMKVSAKYARNEPLGPSKTAAKEQENTERWLAERSLNWSLTEERNKIFVFYVMEKL